MWELYYFSSIMSTHFSDMGLEEYRITNLKLRVKGAFCKYVTTEIQK